MASIIEGGVLVGKSLTIGGKTYYVFYNKDIVSGVTTTNATNGSKATAAAGDDIYNEFYAVDGVWVSAGGGGGGGGASYNGGQPSNSSLANSFWEEEFDKKYGSDYDTMATSSNVTAPLVSGHPGIIRIAAYSASSRYVTGVRFASNSIGLGQSIGWAEDFEFNAVVRLTGTSMTGNFIVGIEDQTFNSGSFGGMTRIAFEMINFNGFPTNDTTLHAACGTNGGSETRTSMGFAPVLNTWYLMRIRKESGICYFSINNGVETAISTNVPTSATNYSSCLVGYLTNYSTDSGLEIDYVSLAYKNLTRY